MLSTCLGDLESGLLAIRSELRRTSLKSAIDRCRGGLQQALESISAWFDVHESRSVQDFRFDLIAETCISSIRRNLPSIQARRVKSEVQADIPPLRGRLFEHLFALMQILLDNAVRHGRNDTDVYLRIKRGDDSLIISIENHLVPEQVSEMHNRFREFSLRTKQERPPTVIRREGGTGFYKLGRIIRVDLSTTDYDVDFALQSDRLTTTVRICDKELLT